jgi:TatD DNase family protein
MLADAHSHLSMAPFDADLAVVIGRASAAGVTGIMTCATSLADAGKNLGIARDHKAAGLRASVGFHPHQASQWNHDSEARLTEMIAESPEIAAIGEVGLDFHYDFSPRPVQADVLRRQIALARSVRLPLVIHCRSARQELRSVMEGEGAREAGGMLHCFSEDATFARFCLDQGFHVSFSGIVTFKNAAEIREAARIVPLDRLLVETDSPYLAPVPHRGRRNEPALVAEVARAVASLKGMPMEAVSEATRRNFEALFGSPRMGEASAAPSP